MFSIAFSLAAYRYRSVFSSEGGPVDQVTVRKFPVLGQPYHQANAFLKPGLVPRTHREVYGQANGTGSSTDPAEAAHMAISESLERWACHTAAHGPNAAKYGFTCDCSSNGMAAFPGLFARLARKRAYHEALERFALIGWWDGRFEASHHDSPLPGISLVRIRHGMGPSEVAVVYRRSASGFASYGHAAGSNLVSATTRAAIELARNEFVIAAYRARGALAEATHSIEQRCLYYASSAGLTEFLEHVAAKPTKPAPKWRVIYDGEITGPWSQYATVWRTCVEPPTTDFLDPTKRFFFW